mmetsp:Transcript_32848/g.32541  ORF Transcript_32848/g.32541 Transcript_32848/m.32541 type:complete len:434 (+) Transcript_32848:14-1315(+)
MFSRILKFHSFLKAPVRNYNLHEYQSVEILNKFKIPTPLSFVAHSPEEAVTKALKINQPEVVVKAQVLAGGRGKGHFIPNEFKGGVHICPVASVQEIASKMIGQSLVTKQTGSKGKPCNKVMVAEKVSLKRELYLAILLDRKYGGPVIVISSKGGMDIEEVARKEPQEIHSVPINIHKGITQEVVNEVSQLLNIPKNSIEEVIKNLYTSFVKLDMIQLEINPLGVTQDDKILICDSKLNFDENASFRQNEIYSQRDLTQENQDEIDAHKYGLSYIAMDGNIGCLVNGAGLAMATMDIIKLVGGSPANFLDVGGGAQEDQIVNALRILETNDQVDGIFINIFGGIMRCDIIAQGLVSAARKIHLTKPIVARLCGTNWREAGEILRRSDMSVITEQDEEEAVKKIVKISEIARIAKDIKVHVTYSPVKDDCDWTY